MATTEKFLINPTNEFHVLRHFEFVDDLYKESLINKPYWYYDYSQKKYILTHISKNDIEYALETIGTKFYKNIEGIENPKKLLELIREKFVELISESKIRWTLDGENRVAKFTINHNYAVGMTNVLSINNLTKSDKDKIKSVARSRCLGENKVTVNTISGIELPFTSTIYVEIIETTQIPFYVMTAFPDCSVLDDSSDNISDDDLVFVV